MQNYAEIKDYKITKFSEFSRSLSPLIVIAHIYYIM